jgi:hypothetical protein
MTSDIWCCVVLLNFFQETLVIFSWYAKTFHLIYFHIQEKSSTLLKTINRHLQQVPPTVLFYPTVRYTFSIIFTFYRIVCNVKGQLIPQGRSAFKWVSLTLNILCVWQYSSISWAFTDQFYSTIYTILSHIPHQRIVVQNLCCISSRTWKIMVNSSKWEI